MKKFRLLCLCCALVMILAACGTTPGATPSTSSAPSSSPIPSASAAPSASPIPSASPSSSESMGGDEEGNPEVSVPKTSEARNAALVAAFTPENADVVTDVAGMLILKSDQSLGDLIAFYQGAAAGLGAVQSSVDDSSAGGWVYNGTYGDNQMLIIELRDSDGGVSAIVTY